MTNVIKLASSNPNPRQNPCTSCAHFHPDTYSFGKEGWEIFGFGPGYTPSANAVKFGVCSFRGGEYASIERRSCQGSWWEETDE